MGMMGVETGRMVMLIPYALIVLWAYILLFSTREALWWTEMSLKL
jgi:hypothetical protein